MALLTIFAMLAMVAASSDAQSVVYNTSFDKAATISGWDKYIQSTECPCPTASVNMASKAAARTGSAGVAVSISVTATQGWHVQLQSPQFNLSASKLYTACFWVRTSKGSATVHMSLLEFAGYVFIRGANLLAATNWQQVCINDFQPPSGSTVYYTLDLGLIQGTLYVDDFTLTSRPDSSAEDNNYVNKTNVAARIEKYRKGDFSIKFVNKTTNKPITGKLASLKLRLSQHDFPFGSAMEWWGVPAAQLDWYLATAKKHFNAMVPEWSFKWPAYEPVKGQYQNTYNYLINNHIKFATANDFVLSRGHTLEWYLDDAGFVNHWSHQDGCDAYRTYLRNRITRELSLFKGKFQAYDVFNEVLHTRQFVSDCPGMWPGILYDGFRWAAAADPTAQLCLNEYDLITGDDWQGMLQLVKDMLANKVPIHCIGVQAYTSTSQVPRPTPAYMKPRLDQLASLNLSIYITEFNFMTGWEGNTPVWGGTQAQHAALYDEYLRFWFSVPYIKGILMWGFWDSSNWIRNGGLYTANGTAKAAAATVASLWGSTWNTTTTATNVALSSKGVYGPTRGFYGKYVYEVTLGSKKFSGTVRFPAANGTAQTAVVYL
ncbi:hypothetical protein Agub_g5974 [Astrephomene gubernaculifera]|uniref:GH10 domain-containing protein n=1 Tax=Astrephomene gubernaculifera TaxID=47775 RepID=A0AAD3DQ53_9CHLO|nr:hypothetical protein Agub_g5974 [Astrephomene gubernaculifera]